MIRLTNIHDYDKMSEAQQNSCRLDIWICGCSYVLETDDDIKLLRAIDVRMRESDGELVLIDDIGTLSNEEKK